MELKNQLKQYELFFDVDHSTLDKILQVGKILKVQKGTELIRFREKVDFIYIQLSGKSSEYVLTNNGKRKILFVLGQGNLLNNYVFNNRSSSSYCETLEDSQILTIPMNEFEKMMAKDFNLAKNVLMTQEKKFGRLSHQLKNTSSSISMEKKLLAKLWKLAKDFGVKSVDGIEIDLNLSITFLADMLGAPRETTSRLCSNLVDAGLIKINKKRIIILNPDQIALSYRDEKKRQFS